MKFDGVWLISIKTSGNLFQFLFKPVWFSFKDGQTSEHKITFRGITNRP